MWHARNRGRSSVPSSFAACVCLVIVGVLAWRVWGGRETRRAPEAPTHTLTRTIGPLFLKPGEHRAIEAEFSITNPSRQTAMRPKYLKRSCTCTDFELDREIIPPGESGTARVRVDVPARTDHHDYFVTYATGVRECPEVTLHLRVDCYETLTVFPEQFGTVEIRPRGSVTVPFEVVAHQPHGLPADPIEVRSETPDVSARVESQAVEERDGFRIVIARCRAVVDPAPQGRDASIVREAVLHVEHGGSYVEKTMRWGFEPSLHVRPERLFLQLSADHLPIKHVELTSETAFQILEIEDSSDFITAAADPRISKRAHDVQVSVEQPERVPRATVAELEFRTDHPDHPVVGCHVFLLAPPGGGE